MFGVRETRRRFDASWYFVRCGDVILNLFALLTPLRVTAAADGFVALEGMFESSVTNGSGAAMADAWKLLDSGAKLLGSIRHHSLAKRCEDDLERSLMRVGVLS